MAWIENPVLGKIYYMNSLSFYLLYPVKRFFTKKIHLCRTFLTEKDPRGLIFGEIWEGENLHKFLTSSATIPNLVDLYSYQNLIILHLKKV